MNPPSSSPPRPSLAPPHSDDYSKQSPPDGPSPSYLELMSTPSKTLSEPTHKLLILNLNGTPLLRSPRAPRSYRGRRHPAPCCVMPRAYLTASRAYLFAPRTCAWLNVMVRSSAQLHSVEDMMLDTFGRDRDNFLAIYARDTLGLTEDHYRASSFPHNNPLPPHDVVVPPFVFLWTLDLCSCTRTPHCRPQRSYFQEGPTLPVCASYRAGSLSLISRIAND
jgi:hypothetical protein